VAVELERMDGSVFGPRTTHQYVRDRLREAIIRGELKGGSRLIQNEIAEQHGVSTTPVREALRDLATEGLIQFDAHRGAVVHEVDVDEFVEIYEMRVLLEPLAIRKSVLRMTEEELRYAERIQDLAEREEDPGKWVELNRRFHAAFVDAARSPRLSSIIKQLRDSSALYVGFVLRTAPMTMASANAEHREFLDACRRRDVEGAVELARQHLETTRQAGSSLSGRQ
jgi:DNA-binding GntR family transcriptional regulator